jgi:hypothetical protein
MLTRPFTVEDVDSLARALDSNHWSVLQMLAEAPDGTLHANAIKDRYLLWLLAGLVQKQLADAARHDDPRQPDPFCWTLSAFGRRVYQRRIELDDDEPPQSSGTWS